ncbi:hypothetical protein [Streptomyces sp. NPDC085596]|uniref:effector-associated constant component EACC1 n=1 Tax=Streptomyces sp. NPDC085596 TaxID=3365731 RepID=UPI0037CE859B
MRLRILADGDEESVADLETWLASDPGTVGLVTTPVTGRAPTMGALEALDVIVGSATEIANFALAYVTWRSVRKDGQPVSAPATGSPGGQRLMHGDTTVDVGHLSVEELGELLRRLNTAAPTGTDT